MKLNYLILSLLLFLFSCKTQPEREKIDVKEKTPEVLTKRKGSFNLGLMEGRWHKANIRHLSN